MMKEVSTPPFDNIFSAFAYIRYCNPARAKAINLLEPESAGASDRTIAFGNEVLYTTVLTTIAGVLKKNKDPRQRAMFEMLYLDEYTREDIIKRFGIHRNTLANHLNKACSKIEIEMIDRRIVPGKLSYE